MLQVLIVDSNEKIRVLTQMISTIQSEYTVVGEAGDGESAISLLKQQWCDLVIVDYQLPDMTGIEFIEQVRANISKKIRFIVTSAQCDYTLTMEMLRHHIAYFLLSPYQKEQLETMLEKIILESEKQRKVEFIKKSKEKMLTTFYLERHFLKKASSVMLQELHNNLGRSKTYQYFYIEVDREDAMFIALSEIEKSKVIPSIVEWMQEKYTKIAPFIFAFMNMEARCYDIGIVVTDGFEGLLDLSKEEFLSELKVEFSNIFPYRIFYCLGKEVSKVEEIGSSFENAIEKKRLIQNEPGNQVLFQLEKEVYARYNEELSLKTLSEKYYMNSAYLGQLFKKEYGMYFKDYLNRVRIHKAKEQLKETNYKVYQIAKDVGYNNTDHFINTFTREVGMTPSKYRRLKKGEVSAKGIDKEQLD